MRYGKQFRQETIYAVPLLSEKLSETCFRIIRKLGMEVWMEYFFRTCNWNINHLNIDYSLVEVVE